jgi:hypothetical protein
MRICPICRRKYESAEIRFCTEDGQTLVEQANLSAQSQPPPNAEQAAAPFSPSLALAFFAHRFIENVPSEDYGTEAFCQPNVMVSSWQLVTELPMIAFWYLLENNCIRLTPVVRQGVFKKNLTLVIEANPAGQVSVPGLEYDFWGIIKSSPPGVTVESVFMQFLGRRTVKPEENLAKRLIEWMIELGCGQPDNSPKPFFRMGSIPLFEKFKPDCRRIATYEQAAQDIHRRWMKFRAEQPDIVYYLFDDILDAAIDRIGNNRVRSSDYCRAETIRLYGKT